MQTGSAVHEAMKLYRAGHLARARDLCAELLRGDAKHVPALSLLSAIEAQSDRLDHALDLLERALAVHPSDAGLHVNRGSVLAGMGRLEEASSAYGRAIELQPRLRHAFYNRGVAAMGLERFQAAVEDFDAALSIDPQNPSALFNRAVAEIRLSQFERAIASLDAALALRPTHAESHYNRGLASSALGRLESALESYDRALALRPTYAEALNNRGSVLARLERYPEAVESFDAAVAASGRGDINENRTTVLQSFPSIRLFRKRVECRWESHQADISTLELAVQRDRIAMPPFPLLSLIDAPALQLEAARTWVRNQPHESIELESPGAYAPHERIRVGYFSWDFRAHAVGTAIAQLLEVHDREQFEWTGFSLGPDSQDATRQRLQRCFDRFIDVRGRSDRDVAQLARDLRIDVAVDLNGHTMGSRPGIFAQRAAPVQVNYLGYPGTMGAPFIDYLIADETVIPEGSERYYDEKIIYMPHSYLVSDATRTIAARDFTRAELGLPERGFVYCCFNTSYKITPEVFEIWMRILRRVEDSVLWLTGGNEAAQANLQREAQRHGLDAQRLIFALRMESMSEHLARHRCADLFLDTLPYNAHSMASDALWAGLPVLTRLGESFAGRVAGSLLRALELPELITATAAEYEELAVALAGEPQRLAEIRARLWERRRTSALYDTPRYARNLESAYRRIHERRQANQPVEHLRQPTR